MCSIEKLCSKCNYGKAAVAAIDRNKWNDAEQIGMARAHTTYGIVQNNDCQPPDKGGWEHKGVIL
jgi:hypothetical protein